MITLELHISRDFDYRQTSGMSWGSEQNYELTQIKTLLNPPVNGFLVLYGWFKQILAWLLFKTYSQ